ncbi:uncharacterized protein LOC129256026 [Lytechinus pictus]|uniref:uncharacterized protein LOC129256026 n=1 Tax=Lytechinus pictus TaxID=7653 RepID=UPI0030B9D85A
MSYYGTQELMDADPLPAAVRVVEAHCSIRKDEDQEADEILDLIGFEKDEERGRLLVGMSGSSLFKYSTELTTSRYTTMLSPDYLRMSEIVERKFPQRVRIPDEKKDFRERNFKEEKVLLLDNFTTDNCVLATRALDNQIYSIPVSAPMKMKHLPMAPKDNHALDILSALYPLVNTTWGLVDPTQETLTSSMTAIPQPIQAIIDAWFTSEEGKRKACDVADRRVDNMKEELTSVYTEIRILKANLDSHSSSPLGSPSDQPPPPRPPRTPTQNSPKQVKQLPSLPMESLKGAPPRLPPRPPNVSSPAEEEYQTVEEATSPISAQSSQNINVMNEVREVLAKKERELQEKTNELNQLKKHYKILKEENASLKAASPIPVYDDIPDIIVPKTGVSDGEYLEPNLPPRSRSLKKYSVAEVGFFLRKHDLGKYVDTFRVNCVDGRLLVSLEEEHLVDLQMSRLHALKLKLEIENMELPPLPP